MKGILLNRKSITLFILIITISLFLNAFGYCNAEASVKLWNAGTTGEGSVAYVAIATMSELVNRYAKDFQLTPIALVGSIGGLKSFDKREVDSTYASAQQLDMVINKIGAFAPENYIWQNPFSIMFWMYAQEFYVIVREEDAEKYKTWGDLKGSKIFPMTKGTSCYEFSLKALGPDGLNIWDTFDVKSFHRDHAADALKLGEIDALMGYGVGVSAGWVQEVIARVDTAIVTPTEDEMEVIINSAPYISSAAIYPENLPSLLNEKRVTPGVGYCYLVDPEMEADYVYEALKTMFENTDDLKLVAPALWRELSNDPVALQEKYLSKGTQLGIPLHPGTERLLKELGCDL